MSLVRLPPAGIEQQNPARRLIDAFMSGRSPHTLRGYTEDLERFRLFTGAPTPEAAATLLLGGGHGRANELLLAFRGHLQQTKKGNGESLSAATINRAITAVRSLVKVARLIGLIAWTVEVPLLDAQKYRDTRGPGVDAVKKMLAACTGGGLAACRDLALLRMLYNQGFRRAEVVSLDVGHVHFEKGVPVRVSVLGKKRKARELVSLSKTTSLSLGAWLEVHPSASSAKALLAKTPVFVALDRYNIGKRLTGDGLRRVVIRLGNAVGVRARPHGLRHTAITETLDRSGGNLRKVQKFSRHADAKTLQHYDDAREDYAKEMSDLLDDEGDK